MGVIEMRNADNNVLELIRYLPEKVRMAEVGVYAGHSAKMFCSSGKVVSYCGIDAWIPYDPADSASVSDLAGAEVCFDGAVAQYPGAARKMKMSSEEAAGHFDDGSLDFVYIDADHRYEAVRRDIGAWMPKVCLGGLVGGHDFCGDFPGVVRAVGEVFGKPDKVFPDTSWIARKKLAVSVAIPCHGDRSGWVSETLANVAGLVAEVVLVDDASEPGQYEKLVACAAPFPNVKVHRNGENLGMVRNKRRAVELCSSPWVVLFDSDNVMDKGYLEALAREAPWKTDTMYVPERSCFDYSPLRGTIDRGNVGELHATEAGRRLLPCVLNNGNFMVGRDAYLRCSGHLLGDASFGADGLNLSRRWLAGGGKVRVVEGLAYRHSVHDGSVWMQTAKDSEAAAARIMEGLLASCRLEMPEDMRAGFTMDGRVQVHQWVWDERGKDVSANYLPDKVEDIRGRVRRREENYYPGTNSYMYQSLERYPVAGKSVLVYGSENPWYELMALEFGAARVVVVEYGERKARVGGVSYVRPEELGDEKFDFVFSVSSFEHDGLGRYGDPMDPDGDLKAMAEAGGRLKGGGLMFLAVPVGRDAMVWNANRVYGALRLPLLLKGWRTVFSPGFSEADFSAGFGDVRASSVHQPVFVLEREAVSEAKGARAVPEARLPFRAVVLWGHKLGNLSDTCSFVYLGIKRAAESMGYDTLWLDDSDDAGAHDLSECLFVTNGGADRNIPLRDDCWYAVWYWDKAKYSGLAARNRAVNFVPSYWLGGKPCDVERRLVVAPETVGNMACWEQEARTIHQPWRTDLLPREIAELKGRAAGPVVMRAGFVGLMNWSGPPYDMDKQWNPFMLECGRNGVPFEHRERLSPEETVDFIRASHLAPAVQMHFQCELSYLPCRIFKNLSYGKMGITNNPFVKEVLGDMVVLSEDTAKLFHAAMEETPGWSRARASAAMDLMAREWTYVSWMENVFRVMFGREALSAKPAEAKQRVSTLTFSKDRPMFLDAHLGSLEPTVSKGGVDSTVYYMASSEEMASAYAELAGRYPWARLVRQSAREEMLPFLKSWADGAGKYVLTTVDDNVFAGELDLGAVKEAMRDGDVFGFTLRLHPGIRHTHVEGEADDPGPAPAGRVTTYEPARYGLPWSYVWEVSSTVFRRESLVAVLGSGRPILSANDLETVGLEVFPSASVKRMACFDRAPATNVFVDSWLSQRVVSKPVSNDDALRMYRSGEKVDVDMTFRRRDEAKVTHVKELFLKRLSNSAVVVVPSWNCEKWTERCLGSILGQTYKDLGVVFVDDASTDGTLGVARRLLEGWKDAVVVSNGKRMLAMRNHVAAVREKCSNPESVVFVVDGDDWLACPTAVEEMMEKHRDHDVVWSRYEATNGDAPISGPLEGPDVRGHKWVSSHLRSYKKFLFDSIGDEDLRDEDGEYYGMTCDMAVMLPILEMVPPERRLFYDKCLYVYNRGNPASDDRVDWAKQAGIEKRVRSARRYPVHPRYLEGRRDLFLLCFPAKESEELKACHSGFRGGVGFAETEGEAVRRLKEAKAEGFSRAMVVRPGERLSMGPGELDFGGSEAVRLLGSSEGREVPVVRLDVFDEYWQGTFDRERYWWGGDAHTHWRGVFNLDNFCWGRKGDAIDGKRYACDIRRDARVVVSEAKAPDVLPKMAVVVLCFRLKEEVLAKHLSWNGPLYERFGATVLVVSDREMAVPPYARCLVYPRPMPVFSISAASNYGIRFAVDAGFGVVVKTDIDVVMSESAMMRFSELDDGRALFPSCYFVDGPGDRSPSSPPNMDACGIVGMTAGGWRKAHFHEGCLGYGEDDQILALAAREAGMVADSGGSVVWHVAHDRGERSAYNPYMDNNRFRSGPRYESPDWGLPGNEGYLREEMKRIFDLAAEKVRKDCASAHEFDEGAYLEANADVRAAVGRGEFASGWEHFVLYGHAEMDRLGCPSKARDMVARVVAAVRGKGRA